MDVNDDILRGSIGKPINGFPVFTNEYTRTEGMGTWFTEDEDDYMHDVPTRYSGGGTTMYKYLFEKWAREGRPTQLWADPPYHSKYWLTSVRYQVTVERGMPQFFWEHGWIPLEWGSRMHFASQRNHTILGGFGCSKTTHVGVSALTYCCALEHFRFVCVAAFLSNAKPMFQEVCTIIEGTKIENFIARDRSGKLKIKEYPSPSIIFKNGSRMLWMGADRDIGKLRSESGDWYCVEQSESHSDLGRATLELGTRARGRVKGRKRLGRFTFIANSGDAPLLWERFDMAEEEPSDYFSYNLTSYDNPHLDDDDIRQLERACKDDKDEIDQYMRGLKPVGRFHDFPRGDIFGCEDKELDRLMTEMRADRQVQHDVKYVDVAGLGPILWSLPPSKMREYAVFGDPGSKNPPERGMGTVFVFDITNWPKSDAALVHFELTVGNNKIGPWIDAFEDAIKRYDAQGMAFYDATGDQKNLDELSFEDRGMLVEGINMTGRKYGMRMKLTRILERRKFRWARSISIIRQQFASYTEALDRKGSKLQQDIIMTFFLAAEELGRRMIIAGKTEKPGAVRRMVRGRGGLRRNRRVTRRIRR